MESFNLNIIPGKDRPVCHASQFDIGRTIHVNLFEGFNVFTLDGTEVISISVRKPDGNVVTEAVTNTSDSYVEFVTTEQMTACSGSNLCELKLEKGADVIGTMNFILEVEQDPLDGGVQSDTNIHNLQTQVADLVAIEVADQYDSGNVIFDNTPTAGHGIGYAVTSEGVKNANEAAIGTVEAIIGDAYDENNTYNTGDYCINSDVLYKCNDDNVTGPWDATKWDATTVADELLLKADAINTYTKTDVDTALAGKQNTLTVQTGTMSAESGTTILRQTLFKFGNVVFLSCDLKVATVVRWSTFATLPNGFKPVDNNIYSMAINTGSSSGVQSAHVQISTGGALAFGNTLPDANVQYSISAAWIVN